MGCGATKPRTTNEEEKFETVHAKQPADRPSSRASSRRSSRGSRPITPTIVVGETLGVAKHAGEVVAGGVVDGVKTVTGQKKRERKLAREAEIEALTDKIRRLECQLEELGGDLVEILDRTKIFTKTHHQAELQHKASKLMAKRRAKAVATVDEGEIADVVQPITPGEPAFASPPLQLVEAKDNVEEEETTTVALPSVDIDWDSQPRVEFGQEMKDVHFKLDENRLFLNAASYGATPKVVCEARRQWEEIVQSDPVVFQLQYLIPLLKQCVQQLSKLIHSDPNNTVLLVNANAATSTVLKSLPWRAGDSILTFSVDYDATKLAMEHLNDTCGVEILEIPLKLPMTDDEILQAVEDFIKTLDSTPLLANFCHVTSKTAWLFPAKRLVSLFHKYHIPVMVDGAQAAGQHPINVSEINADYYLGTVHKWMYTPQGVAFLVTAPHKQETVFPLTVSYHLGKGYQEEFAYTGVQDFTSWIAMLQAFQFVEHVCGGWTKVRTYCHELAHQAVELLEQEWGTKCIQDKEHRGALPIMPLPQGENAPQGAEVKVMAYLLVEIDHITAFCLMEDFGGVPTLCVRLTCQIFNSLEDYKKLAVAINNMKGAYGSYVAAGLELLSFHH
eukprot:TRINITY_DN62743_c0_g1_i1.p1 TRINITY_DN62743_c0_g1~~TRINITY_DN62743_c0_g1_i1.p1  ORF type:complete len:616 (+),score=50.64 TRINITY_DN62743_c0_g1_i1:61-1908(+)